MIPKVESTADFLVCQVQTCSLHSSLDFVSGQEACALDIDGFKGLLLGGYSQFIDLFI